MADLMIRCVDCPKSEDFPWLPWTAAATCSECAAGTVARHLEAFPGHRCTVVGGEPESSVQLRKRQG